MYWTSPDVLNIPRCTEHTLYRVLIGHTSQFGANWSYFVYCFWWHHMKNSITKQLKPAPKTIIYMKIISLYRMDKRNWNSYAILCYLTRYNLIYTTGVYGIRNNWWSSGSHYSRVCSVNFEPPTESPWKNAVPAQLWLFLLKMTSSWHDLKQSLPNIAQ